MRILVINFEYPPLGGGGGVATQDMTDELGKRHEVTVLTTHFGQLPAVEKRRGVTVRRVKVWGRRSLPTASVISMITFAPAAFWVGKRLLSQEKYDVINAQFVIPSGVPAAWLAKRFKLPLVVSLVGGDLYDPSKGLSPHRHWWLRWCVSWVAKRANICTAISTDTRRRAVDIYGINKEIVVTHLGVKEISQPASSPPIQRFRDKGLNLISIGRLIPRKGYEVLLRALKQTRGVNLIVIGEGPLENKLKAMIKSLDLSDRIIMTGFVSEQTKQQYLAAADAYVSASEHEGFGIVFLEAMQWGKPIIATDNGGQIDFLSPEMAILVKPGDDKSIAAAINKLKHNPNLREQMGKKSKQKAADFMLPATARKFEEVLIKAIEN